MPTVSPESGIGLSLLRYYRGTCIIHEHPAEEAHLPGPCNPLRQPPCRFSNNRALVNGRRNSNPELGLGPKLDRLSDIVVLEVLVYTALMQLPLDYTPPPPLLKDKVILITGAGAGIGRAVARLFARQGAIIVLCGRTVKKLEAVYDEIEAAGDSQPAIFPLDLLTLTPDTAVQLYTSVDTEFGRLDGLLHNAGILGAMTSIENYDPQLWMEVMQVNVNAQYLLTATLLPLLRKAVDARCVFTSSTVGQRGRAYWGAYAVSKFATEGLMQVLAEETESEGRIRVNCINPGATRTAMRARAYPAEDPQTLRAAQDIAPGYLYLFGPEGRALHGQSCNLQ